MYLLFFFFLLLCLSGSIYAQDIYNFTRRAIDPEASLTRYDVPRGNISPDTCIFQ